jgi:hypothetical protein
MGLISTGPGSPLAFSSASGGKVYAWNTLDDTTPVQVAPANTQRQKITFHNPGTVDVIVFPEYVQTTGSNVAATTTVVARGGGWLVYGNGGTLVLEGECQGAWKALSVSGSGNPLTVMDSNT